MTSGNIEINSRVLSHELRISLAGILGGVELLDITDVLSTAQKEQVEMIRQSGNRLLDFINKMSIGFN